MTAGSGVQRVRIYLREGDRWESQPLYGAVLDYLRREGATGATVFQGVAGFGPRQATADQNAASLTENLPVVVEWIDREERVARLLLILDQMLPNALITLEAVTAHRAVLRSAGAFAGERTVGDVMHSVDHTCRANAMLTAVLTLMLDHQQSLIPVVGPEQQVVGTVSEQDVLWRTKLRLPFDVLRVLQPDERRDLFANVDERTVANVMGAEPRSILRSMAIPQALVKMVEWGCDQVAVVEHNATLCGMLNSRDVLRASLDQAEESETIRNAEPPTLVHLIMQTSVPKIDVTQPLVDVLAPLLVTPERRLMVVDADNRLQGSISAASVLQGMSGDQRAVFLAALRSNIPVSSTTLADAEQPIDPFVERDVPVIAATATVAFATRRLLDLDREQIAVVDDEQRLIGSIARSGLVRALMQQSE